MQNNQVIIEKQVRNTLYMRLVNNEIVEKYVRSKIDEKYEKQQEMEITWNFLETI